MKWLERILWISGSVLLSIFLGHLAMAELQRASDVAEFREQRLASAAGAISEATAVATQISAGDPDQRLWSDKRKEEFADSVGRSTSEVLGIFTIPKFDLEVPIYDGASELHMNRGIAVVEGTAMPGQSGNMGIAGHRDGYFRVLKDIEVGDEMSVLSGRGTNIYKVEELMIVEPSAVEVLDPTDQTAITLVTCYPFYFVGHAPQRFIVRAVLQE